MKIELNLNWDGIVTTGWTDYTDSVNLSTFAREVSLNEEQDPQKSISADVEFFGSSFTAIKTNLIDSSDRYANFYAVRITDTDCDNTEYLFKIEDKSFKWCDNGECKMLVSLLEWNEQLDCFRKTLISDNTNLNFQDYPLGGMIHPRFRYCDVFKPTLVYYWLLVFTSGVTLIISAIITVINTIASAIANIYNTFPVLGHWNYTPISYGFAEDILGCKRGHPAPYIRSYVDNVCDQCGISVTNTSFPVIYDTAYNGFENPYYFTCLATAPNKKGVNMNGSKDYIPNNSPTWTGLNLLSKLKKPFNARWIIHDGVLWMERKDLIGSLVWAGAISLDLSADDAEYLISEICYTYNGESKPKRLLYQYMHDSGDNIGNELLSRFNGEYIDTSGNKNFTETIETNLFDFAPAACVLDGQDSQYDAAIDTSLAGLLTQTDYAGCLKTQGDTFTLAKLLIHNPDTPIEDARSWGSNYDIYGSVGADLGAFKDDDPDFLNLHSYECSNYNWALSFDHNADNISGNGIRNLWQFHSIDAPDQYRKSNIDIEFTLLNCCRYKTLNLFQTVLLPDGTTEAEINFVKFDYQKREILVKATLKN